MTVHGISGHNSQTTFFIHTDRLWSMRKTLGNTIRLPHGAILRVTLSAVCERERARELAFHPHCHETKKRALKEPPSPPEACTNYHYQIEKRNSLVTTEQPRRTSLCMRVCIRTKKRPPGESSSSPSLGVSDDSGLWVVFLTGPGLGPFVHSPLSSRSPSFWCVVGSRDGGQQRTGRRKGFSSSRVKSERGSYNIQHTMLPLLPGVRVAIMGVNVYWMHCRAIW
jgi:hypothetical protein